MSIRTLVLPTTLGASWGRFAWSEKSPEDQLDYHVDATEWLADAGLSLLSADMSWSPGLTVAPVPVDDGATVLTLRISGGVPSTIAAVRVLLHLSSGEELEVVISLPIRAAAPDGLISGPGGNGPPPTADSAATTDSDTITADAG